LRTAKSTSKQRQQAFPQKEQNANQKNQKTNQKPENQQKPKNQKKENVVESNWYHRRFPDLCFKLFSQLYWVYS